MIAGALVVDTNPTIPLHLLLPVKLGKDDPRPKVSTPTSALEFLRVQVHTKVFNKQWMLGLNDVAKLPPGIVEVQVQGGDHKHHTVQFLLLSRNTCIKQCSCEEFCTSQKGFCEHTVLVSAVQESPTSIPGGKGWHLFLQNAITKQAGTLLNCNAWLPIARKPKHFTNFKILPTKAEPISSVALEAIAKHPEWSVQPTPIDLFPVPADCRSEGLLEAVSLYDYQEEIFKGMLKAKRAICSMVMGSGKTLTTIAIWQWLRKNHWTGPKKTLIICPKSLKRQWEKEILRTTAGSCSQIDSVKDLELIGKSEVTLVTYQLFARHSAKFSAFVWDFIVMDEIQFIRNEDSKVWEAASTLKSEFFYGLSGTPVENGVDDLYAIMQVIHPGFLGPKWKFSDQFQELVSITKKTIVFRGVKNVPELRKLLEGKVFSYDKLSLPKATYSNVFCDMSKLQLDTHDNFYGEAKKLLAKSMTQGLTYSEKMYLQSLLLKARQACNTIALITKEKAPPSPKMLKILEIIKATKGKVVLFSQWTQFLDLLKEMLLKEKIQFVSFTGEENEKQRAAAVERFSSDVNCKVFLASDSGGVGLDGLQYASSTVIHCELPWNPAKLDQRTGRVLRIGQTQPVTVYHMVARGTTIENNMLEVLASKRDIREEILKT